MCLTWKDSVPTDETLYIIEWIDYLSSYSFWTGGGVGGVGGGVILCLREEGGEK